MLKRASKLLVVVFLLSVLFTSFNVFADTKATITEEQKKDILKVLKEKGVPEDKQNNLIHKLEKGELWDALDPQKRALVEDKLKVSKNKPIARYDFQDGSFIERGITDITIIEDTRESIDSILSGSAIIDATQIGSGSGYVTYRAHVYEDMGVIKYGFRSLFTLVNDENDYITSAYDGYCTSAGGGATNGTPTVAKATESLNGPARAEMYFSYTGYGGYVGHSGYLVLEVSDDDYYGYYT